MLHEAYYLPILTRGEEMKTWSKRDVSRLQAIKSIKYEDGE